MNGCAGSSKSVCLSSVIVKCEMEAVKLLSPQGVPDGMAFALPSFFSSVEAYCEHHDPRNGQLQGGVCTQTRHPWFSHFFTSAPRPLLCPSLFPGLVWAQFSFSSQTLPKAATSIPVLGRNAKCYRTTRPCVLGLLCDSPISLQCRSVLSASLTYLFLLVLGQFHPGHQIT